jgi:hypothetical protein
MGMVFRKEVKITRDEAIRYLFMESEVVPGLVTSAFSSVLSFLFAYVLLYLIKYIVPTTTQFLFLIAIFFTFGMGYYFLKREEFVLFDKTHAEVFVHGLITFPVSIILFTSIIIYFVLPEWKQAAAGSGIETQTLSSIIMVLLIGIVSAYVFIGLWNFVDFYLLQLFAKRDWFILAEREVFVNGLGMRFEEARRYGTALSLLNMTIDISPRKRRLLDALYKKIVRSLRDIDSISHYENWNNIVILAPITAPACHGLFNRIANIINDELVAKGIKDAHVIEAGISTVTAQTESEYDLLKTTPSLKFEIKKA